MTREEHTQLIESIRNAETDVDRNKLLLQLTDDYSQVLTAVETTTAESITLKNENDKYARLNNDLFLRLSAQDTTEIPTGGEQETEPPTKLSFDDLQFD